MVTTDSLKAELEARGFSRLVVTRRGVDHELFHPSRRTDLGLPRPISLCVARVAVEKNLPAFFELDIPGTKVMVGDGPDRDRLQRKYPGVVFAGLKEGAALAAFFASADVFVFPSLTDTFGLVLLEAISSGTPVAAFDVTGPRDVIEHGVNGLLGPDLRQSFFACLNLDRETVQRSSLKWSWPQCAQVYLDNFHWLNGPPAPWPETGGPKPDGRLNPSS
jgi:glycosyltransferase involved in cell wall biosynthesis